MSICRSQQTLTIMIINIKSISTIEHWIVTFSNNVLEMIIQNKASPEEIV